MAFVIGMRLPVRLLNQTVCDHDVQQIEVKPNGDRFQVELRIRLTADSYDDSMMKGEAVNLNVNETWQVSIDESGRVIIHEYSVVPVVS